MIRFLTPLLIFSICFADDVQFGSSSITFRHQTGTTSSNNPVYDTVAINYSISVVPAQYTNSSQTTNYPNADGSYSYFDSDGVGHTISNVVMNKTVSALYVVTGVKMQKVGANWNQQMSGSGKLLWIASQLIKYKGNDNLTKMTFFCKLGCDNTYGGTGTTTYYDSNGIQVGTSQFLDGFFSGWVVNSISGYPSYLGQLCSNGIEPENNFTTLIAYLQNGTYVVTPPVADGSSGGGSYTPPGTSNNTQPSFPVSDGRLNTRDIGLDTANTTLTEINSKLGSLASQLSADDLKLYNMLDARTQGIINGIALDGAKLDDIKDILAQIRDGLGSAGPATSAPVVVSGGSATLSFPAPIPYDEDSTIHVPEGDGPSATAADFSNYATQLGDDLSISPHTVPAYTPPTSSGDYHQTVSLGPVWGFEGTAPTYNFQVKGHVAETSIHAARAVLLLMLSIMYTFTSYRVIAQMWN